MKESNNALIDACFNNDPRAAKEAIDVNMAQINTTEYGNNKQNKDSKSTPIIIASAKKSAPELVLALLDRNPDITIRHVSYWYHGNKKNRITNGNALDVALFFSRVDTVKQLLLYAALHLNPSAQSRLLERMREKNVLLYVAKNYPQYMEEMTKKILEKNDTALTQRIMCDFASLHGVRSTFIDKYLSLFVSKEDLDKRTPTLTKVTFDRYLNNFKKLPSNEHAKELIKKLSDAKVKFLLDGQEASFTASVLEAIDIAIPTLGKQAAWKVAIGHFLEALAIILPIISQQQIQFYKTSDAAQQLARMRVKLSEIPSVPLAYAEVIGPYQELEQMGGDSLPTPSAPPLLKY